MSAVFPDCFVSRTNNNNPIDLDVLSPTHQTSQTHQGPCRDTILSIVGSLRDREVACSASDRQGSNFESCVWRTMWSHSSPHPREFLLAQFSLYVHKGCLKPDSFHSRLAVTPVFFILLVSVIESLLSFILVNKYQCRRELFSGGLFFVLQSKPTQRTYKWNLSVVYSIYRKPFFLYKKACVCAHQLRRVSVTSISGGLFLSISFENVFCCFCTVGILRENTIVLL